MLQRKVEYNMTVHVLFKNFKKAYNQVMRLVIENIFIEIEVSLILLRLIKICLNNACNEIFIYIYICLIVFLSKNV
jgi:hypothetical protein